MNFGSVRITSTDFAALLAGTVFIILGILGNEFYYASGLYGDATKKRAPVWAGRLMFIGVGVLFILFSLKNLYYGH